MERFERAVQYTYGVSISYEKNTVRLLDIDHQFIFRVRFKS